nr:MAG TPA: hypothetical protein [Caudoviricetes sp.]
MSEILNLSFYLSKINKFFCIDFFYFYAII